MVVPASAGARCAMSIEVAGAMIHLARGFDAEFRDLSMARRTGVSRATNLASWGARGLEAMGGTKWRAALICSVECAGK